jgi:hypothetical protein
VHGWSFGASRLQPARVRSRKVGKEAKTTVG